MSYRVWWLIAFWALGIGVAIELEAPADKPRQEPRAEAREVPPVPVAARSAASHGG